MLENLAVIGSTMSPRTTDKSVPTDYKTLQRLRHSCRLTLERYVDLASQSSGQLATMSPDSFDPLRRANLNLLKQKEDRAHEVYLRSRTALLNYVLGEE